MTADDPARDEDLASMLAACDEALAGGQLPPVEPPGDVSAEQSRLLKGLDCVRLLRTVWPRAERPAVFAPAPDHIGRYRIARELGRGGFGIVYLAFDPQLGRSVALKVPRPDVVASPQARERFRREARAAAALDHPNVVAVHEAGEADGTEYIAAAYCPGVTLAKWLEQRTDPPSVRMAVAILLQLVAGVEHAHQRQVLHRDLKPANVLLSFGDDGDAADPVARLTDFGLARSLADVTGAGLTDTGAILGTPNYLAPEQADSKAGPVGPGADVYGLGAILYELLTRRPPFQSDSVLDTLQQVRADDPVPPRRLRSQVPRDLETICLKCLEKSPARRYRSAQELADDLVRFQEGRPILARPPRPVDRMVKWTRRKPTLTAVLVGATLLTLAGAGGGAWYLRDRQVRQARVEREVHAGIEETVSLYGRAEGAGRDLNLWADAVAAARRADAVAAASAVPETRDRTRALVGEIEQWQRSHRLLVELADVQASMGDEILPNGDQDFPAADTRYVRAFQAFGLDPLTATPEQGAEALAGLGPAGGREVAAALDDWGYVRVIARRPREANIDQLARRLDPDPVRNRLRDAIAAGRPDPLRAVAAEIDPAAQPVQTVNLVGVSLYHTGPPRDYTDAIAFLRSAHPHHPGDFQLNHNLAYLLGRDRAVRHAEAVPYAYAAVAIRPKSATAWQDLAAALGQGKREAEAVTAHRRVIALAPRAVWHRIWIGDLLARTGKTDEAEAAYRDAIRVIRQLAAADPASAYHTYTLTWTSVRLARLLPVAGPEREQLLRDSLAAADGLLARSAKNADYRRLRSEAGRVLAALCWDTDRYAEAVALQKAVVAALPDDIVAVNVLAWWLAICPDDTLREPAESVRLAERAVTATPTDANIRNTLGAARSAAGDWAGAVTELEKAAGMRPAYSPDDGFLLAMAHHHLGDRPRAKQLLAEAMQWLAAHPPADRDVGRLRTQAVRLIGE